MSQRIERQGFYERDVDAFNKKEIVKDNPFAKRLEIDTMELERGLARELKEIWE